MSQLCFGDKYSVPGVLFLESGFKQIIDLNCLVAKFYSISGDSLSSLSLKIPFKAYCYKVRILYSCFRISQIFSSAYLRQLGICFGFIDM